MINCTKIANYSCWKLRQASKRDERSCLSTFKSVAKIPNLPPKHLVSNISVMVLLTKDEPWKNRLFRNEQILDCQYRTRIAVILELSWLQLNHQKMQPLPASNWIYFDRLTSIFSMHALDNSVSKTIMALLFRLPIFLHFWSIQRLMLVKMCPGNFRTSWKPVWRTLTSTTLHAYCMESQSG